MDHVAIDLGGKESQVCRRGSDGTILDEKRVRTRALGAYLAKLERSVVTVETCAEAFRVADQAREAGHEVRVVPATLAPSLGVGARGVKTDVRDARALSGASCRMELPSVHVPSVESRGRKSMMGMRDGLVASRTQLINTVRGWLRGEARTVSIGAPDTFGDRVKAIANKEGFELPSFVTRQLLAIGELNAQLAEADQELRKVATDHEVCRRLMTVPGIGPSNALLFVALLDDVKRFPSASAVQSYLGLTAGEQSSSSRQRRTGITKAGSPRMRRLLVQAAWVARRCAKNDPMVRWSLEVEKRRGRRVAIVALARKLGGILFAIWRDGTTYDPSRGASTSYEEAEQAALEAALAMLHAP